MNKIAIAMLSLILIGSGIYFITDMQKNSAETVVVKDDVVVTPAQEAKKDEAAMEKSAVKTFTVSGENFSFSVKEMKVKRGDTVRVVFKNEEGFHDWVIDEFNAKTQKLSAGKTETVEFVADKNGIFEYYCSVGAHRANGMVGKLIVE